MIRIAAPFKDPRTGIFHFRRIIPVALRPFFDGGASEYKRTLDTRDPDEARQRYHPHGCCQSNANRSLHDAGRPSTAALS